VIHPQGRRTPSDLPGCNDVAVPNPGLFPAGSTGPKGEAAAQFARASGRSAVIGSLEQLSSMLAGDGGTRISVHAEGMETR
jgi:carbamate kinase